MINPLTLIKAFFTAKADISQIAKEAKTMNGTTPGWKTSEFWVTLVAQATTLWGAVSGLIPAKYAAIISVVGTAVYTIARTALKAYSTVKAATTPSAATTNVTVATKTS